MDMIRKENKLLTHQGKLSEAKNKYIIRSLRNVTSRNTGAQCPISDYTFSAVKEVAIADLTTKRF